MADSKHNSLQRGETPFRAIFERAAVGMAQVSLGGRFLLVNQGLCDLWGFSREELLERTFQQISHPDDLDLSVNVSKRLIAREIQTHTTLEKRYIHKDGHVVWGKITVALVRDSVSNEPRYFVSVIEDITQRKQAEQAWHASEERFRFLVDNAPVLMWMSDLDKRCTYFNKPWLDFTGRSLESELGNGWAEGVHPDDLQRCVGTYTQAFDRREEFRMEYRLRRHDGEYRWIFDVGAPLFNEDRSFSGYIGSCVDITERKRAEAELEKHRQHLKELVRERTSQLEAANAQLQSDIAVRKRAEDALRESESRFRAFFETDAVGTAEVDLNWRFVQVNQRFCQITGYSREELLGMTTEELTHPEDRDADRLYVQGRMPILDTDKRYIRKDGSVIWVHVTAAMIRDGEGKLLRSAGVVQDITERKLAEEVLLRNEKLAATGRMAATIAHEVNNPLAGATNALYLASTDPGLKPNTKEYLRIADEELRRATHITRQTLGFYRSSDSPTPIAFSKLIDELLGVYKTKLQSRNITVNRRYRGCEDCFYINPGELRQIISNLLANGMDALRDNGTLYIRVSRITNLNVGGKYIHLTIADNGCGIRVEHLKRIFEPFFTTKESFGTGLGLWVTQELVRKHNGVIKIRSRRDEGTVFRISFPAEQPVSRAATSRLRTQPFRKHMFPEQPDCENSELLKSVRSGRSVLTVFGTSLILARRQRVRDSANYANS